MFANKSWRTLFALVVIAAMTLSACATPTPEVIEKEVIVEKEVPVTVEIEKEVVIEKTVVETVVIEKEVVVEVVVTATPAEGGPVQGGTLVIGIEGEPQSLDVTRGSLATTRITALICENMIGEDTTAVAQDFAPVKPQLAESWGVSEDGLTYTFHLRKGVKFTDGTPFDAEAVKVNFDRFMDPESPVYDELGKPAMAPKVKMIDSYRVVDPYTFEIKLKELFSPFLRSLKHRNFGIISPAALKQWSREMTAEHLVGTGPFKFVEQEQGVKVVLAKNPDYWDKAGGPYLDKVIFHIMPDASARVAALKTGEIDVELAILPDRLKELQSYPNVEVVFPGQPHIMSWGLNLRTPALQNLKVRRAIWHAIDTEGMAKSLLGEAAVPMASFLPPGNPAYRPDYKRLYPYDPEKAKQLLVEAGYAPGELKLNMLYPIAAGSYMDPSNVAQWTQSYLKAVGIEVNLEPYEWASWIQVGREGYLEGQDMVASGIQSIADDPYMLEQKFSTANWRPAGGNNCWYSNPAFDKLLEEARRTTDEAKRISLYQRAEDILLRAVAVIPIVHDKQPRAFHKRVKNLLFGPSPWFELTNVWLEELQK